MIAAAYGLLLGLAYVALLVYLLGVVFHRAVFGVPWRMVWRWPAVAAAVLRRTRYVGRLAFGDDDDDWDGQL